MQGKGNGHVGKTLCRGDKWGHDIPGDGISENEVGVERVFLYPKRDLPGYDEVLPFLLVRELAIYRQKSSSALARWITAPAKLLARQLPKELQAPPHEFEGP